MLERHLSDYINIKTKHYYSNVRMISKIIEFL